MILRSLNRIWPRCLADAACILLVAIFVPVTYIFATTIVLPELFDIGGFWYSALWLAGLFLVFNVTANMLACMLVDTTIKISMLKPPQELELRCLWHMCEDCQALVPPRSWHCEICNICVLKRDHHCRFVGTCIGHYNYRYFFYFLVYLFVGSFITTLCTSFYLWGLHADIYWSLSTAFKIVCPFFMLVIEMSWTNFYLLIYELNILACSITLLLLIYQWPMFKRGSIMKYRRSEQYNLGLRGNIEMVLGKRMYLTWLSPFVRSDLPHDGINWMPTKES